MKKRKERRPYGLKTAVLLCTGGSYWKTRAIPGKNIPAVTMSDGPHGIRCMEKGGGFDMLGVHPARPATCFPASVTLAASWDEPLLERVGRCIGEEARANGVGLVLGPGLNIKRSPLGGRNFEYYSEDPLLSGRLAAAFVRGVQSTGVSACLKHFAVNSQERDRCISDSLIDERTLREIYLAGFETAVREGRPDAVMCAYNQINGVYCSDNRRLLTDILRGEWGFDGLVVTDWGAMHDRAAAFEAGCDLCMPGGGHYGEKAALRAVKSGTLDPARVYESAARVVRLAKKAAGAGPVPYDVSAHHAEARAAAAAGAVLLKNDGGLLPLKSGARVCVLGDMARHMRYQGSGSSHINPHRLSRPLDSMPFVEYSQGCDARGGTTAELLTDAAAAAARAGAAVVFAGLPDSCESEGFDREHMRLPWGVNALIDTVARANPNTCVVLLAGSPVECPWADRVRAVLYMGLPGQAGGEAAADILYGRAEPGGRLTESWPVYYSDCPVSEVFAKTRDAAYVEGVYVGYRYYATAKVPVRWPFGHGLSYTTFAYSNLGVSGNLVTADVTNTGARPGRETVQLYLSPPRTGPHGPVLELKGFKKLRLEPGETRRAEFRLAARDFSLWQDGWRVRRGEYGVYVGASSGDLRLSGSVHVEGEELAAPEYQAGSWYERPAGKPDEGSWLALMGGRAEAAPRPARGSFSMDSTPFEMKDASPVMRAFHGAIRFCVGLSFGADKAHSPEYRMMLACSALAPLRLLEMNGGVPDFLFRALLRIANGKSGK